MKYTFSDKRNIKEAFPISSRRATNTDWKLLDIHDNDGSESQEDKSPDQDEDNRDEQSKLRTVLELAQPTPVDIAPKPKARKIKGSLFKKMFEDSQNIMGVEDPRDSDIVIP